MIHSIESLRLLTEEFTSKSNRVLEYSRHKLATGLHRERIVEAFLSKLTPKALGLGSGFLFDGENSSPQTDVIIYDQNHFSPLFDEGGYLILHPDSVIQNVEVKSILDKSSIAGAFQNIYDTLSLNSNIHSSIFGFDGLQDVNKVFDYIEGFAKENEMDPNLLSKMPDAIVNLNNWVIILVKEPDCWRYVYAKEKTFEEQFLYYFSMIYYKNFSYLRKLLNNNLPSLEEQKFPLAFDAKKVDFLRFRVKNA